MAAFDEVDVAVLIFTQAQSANTSERSGAMQSFAFELAGQAMNFMVRVFPMVAVS